MNSFVLYMGYGIDITNATVIFASVAKSEKRAKKRAIRRYPDLPVITVRLDVRGANIIPELRRKLTAVGVGEQDIDGATEALRKSIIEEMLNMIDGDPECVNLMRTVETVNSVTDLTNDQQDRIAHHYINCPGCQQYIKDTMPDDLTPKEALQGIVAANRTINRLRAQDN